jgi:hypothetical protein
MSEVKTNKITSLASNNDITLDPDGTGDVLVSSGHKLGVGITAPEATLDVIGNSDSTAALKIGPNASFGHHFYDSSTNGDLVIKREVSGTQTETMRLSRSDGNLLVGKTATNYQSVGIEAKGNGSLWGTADGNNPLILVRKSSDGAIAQFYKDSTQVGNLGTESNGDFVINGAGNHAGIRFVSDSLTPRYAGNDFDNGIDLGKSDARFDDVFATNGTIQTSDQNEKQNIASLTTAEMTAAKAISKLFKTFKWNDKVAAKGDAARRHAGVIAQEVQTAMTDAGLDAADYAFWCSDTWWETSTDVPAVEADEEAGIEARDAYTRIDTYPTQADAPSGATERTRLGIRYPELLAFVGAATEQRLADLETRVTALENA